MTPRPTSSLPPSFALLGLLLALAVAGAWPAPAAFGDDPKPPEAAPVEEDPPLQGEEKKKYDAAMVAFEKRYKSLNNRDELLQFLNELDAEGTRAARDWLRYARVVKSAEYRARAFESLARKGGSTVLEFLCGKSGVRSPDALVQKQAVEALSKSGDKRCVPPLLAVLGDAALKMETIAAACLTLAKVDPSDERVKEALLKVSNDRRDTVRAAAFEAMGYGADDKTFALLLDTLQNGKNAAVRAGAAAGLGHAGRKEAIPALKAAVAKEKVQPVREAAMQSLKDLGATTD